MSLSVCCMTNAPPAPVGAMLALFRPVADEIVVAADSRIERGELGPLADVADRLLHFEFAPPVDRANGWLLHNCGGSWILRIDADEVPSLALLDALPALVDDSGLTHYWLRRLWLWPDRGAYLASWPWRTDYQPRLFRNDPALLRTPGRMHTQTSTYGPCSYIDEPLYHLDCLLNSEEERARKARAYERLRPGLRQAGLPMNHAVYLPERRKEPPTMPVPEEDRDLLRRLEQARPSDERSAVPRPTLATRTEIDRHWEDRRLADSAYRARIELLPHDSALVAGEHRGFDVRVRNLGDEVWPWGSERNPRISLSYHWRRRDGSYVGEEGFRTHLPAPLGPGESCRLWAGVTAPREPGRYRLELDMVHEGVRWFDCPLGTELAVTKRLRLAIVGGYNPYRHVGDDAILAAHLTRLVEHAPAIEPRVLGQWPRELEERIGHPTGPSLHGYLLHGLRGGDRRRATHPRLVARAAALLRAARALREGRQPLGLPPSGLVFLRELDGADALLCLGAGAITSDYRLELWTLAVTVLAADTLGLPVAVSGLTVGPFNDLADRMVAALALRRAGLVTVRDRVASRRELRKVGVPGRRVSDGWDDAAALEPAPGEEIDDALAAVGLHPEGDFAAISLHPGPAFPECVDALAAAMDRLWERHALDSVFVPMSLHPEENDHWPAGELRRRLRNGDRFRVLDPLPRDDVLLGLVGRARVAVGTRYHLAVFAAASGVPAVGIQGSTYTDRKLGGLRELAGERMAVLHRESATADILAAVERGLVIGKGPPVAHPLQLPAIDWLNRVLAERR